MKTIKSFTFGQIIVLLNCLVLCLLPVLLSAQGQKQYKFTNHEGQDATDLHIEFNVTPADTTIDTTITAVIAQHPAGTFPDFNGVGTPKINLANGGTGAAISDSDSVILTFGFSGTKPPQVSKWHWTKDNSIFPTDLGVLGPLKDPSTYKFDFVSVEPSTGDGSILLTIDSESHTFEIPPNLLNTDVASAFVSFVYDQFEFGEAFILEGTKVEVYSRAYSNEIYDIFVNITPDSTMGIEGTYVPEVIPTLSEWGVIILVLLILSVGMVFVSKRETVLGLAGNLSTETSASKPKLFDKRLYAKVFGVALLTGCALLGLTYLYFGEITTADPFGTFVSAAIVAYMIHFWILRKPQSALTQKQNDNHM